VIFYLRASLIRLITHILIKLIILIKDAR
jgi:hypothetical protein